MDDIRFIETLFLLVIEPAVRELKENYV